MSRESYRGSATYLNSIAELVCCKCIRVDALQAYDAHDSSEYAGAKDQDQGYLLIERPVDSLEGLDGKYDDPDVRHYIDSSNCC